MPRFVVLEHAAPGGPHWDLMLETGSALATWALGEPPDVFTKTPIPAQALADHRLEYLDYEGPISGGRGSVTRWDAGEYRLERQSQTEWAALVVGGRLSGRIVLARVEGDPVRWQFSYAAQRRAP